MGIRLVLPFSPESLLSLIPSAETVSPDILYAETPKIHSGISVFNTYVNPVISESLAPAVDASVNPMQVVAYIASVVWIIGMIALLLYFVVSYVRLRRRVADAVILRDNLWQSEKVASPFVLGLFRPRIYLPFGMDDKSLAYVVAHEQAHLRHRDHWIKPIGFLLLTVYWFNPLIWLAYILLCRDIELACDERVVKQMSADDKKAYSKALLTCSIDRRSIAACPLAFGEVGVKQRVKNILNYKKPAFWIIIAALVSCVVVAVCFFTNPKEHESIQWARGLQVKDIETAELVDLLNVENERYHLYQSEEYPAIVDLVNSSQGSYTEKSVSTTGYLSYIYITTKDGVRHSFINCKNSYLIIDGDAYAAGLNWLLNWNYNRGDSPLPEGFFDEEYGYAGGGFINTGGSHVPCVLTFDLVDGGAYELTEYWEPRDGSYYTPDIEKRFEQLSPEAASDALHTQKFILAQIQCCYAQTVEHGNVAADYIIKELFESIMSSPAESSNPGDYIEAHPIEYRELTYCGDYTLRYIFSEFLKRGQTGLKGQLMRIVMDDLAPESKLRLYAKTGQEYFDAWRSEAEKLKTENGLAYIQENNHAMWLLLQMLEA